ncbi:hypothetical protein BD410DRAFT_507199 [Rickenella mellea]|uniref:Ricin B lectin domain-containing protein n=1 Tax=Rickenella mellea TaxID=50990 RepID=A0A4Y7PUD9_9AGAM|nr:hypothetical protein BD410DRAFT_507199 [Rickenella mellea]
MAFRAVTGELKTGRYQIQNVQTGQFLELPTSDDNEPVINALQHPAEKQKWDVFECGAGTYKLKNWGQGLWANVARKPQLGSAVICKLAEKQFVIEESRTPGQYRIFMDETELYWILSSGNLGSSITLGRQGDNRNLWSFWTTSRP